MRRFMEESLITVKEVADYLKLKEQTVYLLARQNKIPSEGGRESALQEISN